MYRYRPDRLDDWEAWFNAKKRIMQKYLLEFGDKPFNYLEIGLYDGRTFVWVADEFLKHPQSKGFGIEISVGEYLRHNIKESVNSDKLELLEGNSILLLTKHNIPQLDIIYIDGNHTLLNVFADAILVWGLVKTGGIIIFDDYLWGQDGDELNRPKLAIDKFLDIYIGQYELLLKGYQVVVRKIV